MKYRLLALVSVGILSVGTCVYLLQVAPDDVGEYLLSLVGEGEARKIISIEGGPYDGEVIDTDGLELDPVDFRSAFVALAGPKDVGNMILRVERRGTINTNPTSPQEEIQISDSKSSNEYIQVSCTEKDGVLHSHFRYAGKDRKINRDDDDSK